MLIPVINSGSSSIKFQLLQMEDETLQLSGLLERTGEERAEPSLNLGDGSSISAIEQGRCRDTSMGMARLEGLVMGSRSSDIDPAIPTYLQRRAGFTAEEIDTALNRKSGLRAPCGDNDMRRILQRIDAADRQAQLALDICCQRIRKYIGAYLAVLGAGGCPDLHRAHWRARRASALENLRESTEPGHSLGRIGQQLCCQGVECHPPAIRWSDWDKSAPGDRTNGEQEIVRRTRLLCPPMKH